MTSDAPCIEHAPADRDVLAVLQCAQSKRDGTQPAREKYAHPKATLFRKSRAYVEALGLDYIILSGKYDALLPGDPVDDYDVAVTDRDPVAWRQDVLDALAERDISLDDYDELRLLVGQDYRRPLADVFAETAAEVTTPLADCEGYGYMVGRLTDWIDDIEAGTAGDHGPDAAIGWRDEDEDEEENRDEKNRAVGWTRGP